MSPDQIGVDHRAFLDATMPHLDVVYRIARHAGTDSWAAEDVVQETYLRAFAHFGQFRGGDARAWLAAICLNVTRSEVRRRRRRPAEVPGSEADEIAGEADEVAEQALASLDRGAIEAGLAQLPQEQRLCILLMDVAGYTARETAQILGCPRGTVLARVHRGRRRLASLLTGSRDAGRPSRRSDPGRPSRRSGSGQIEGEVDRGPA